MSKAIQGAALIGGAVLLGVAMTVATGGLGLALNSVLMVHVLEGLALGGLAMEAGAIAGALTSNRGMAITTRQPAAFRQVIYGERRVGGTIVYQSTTGSHRSQYNFVIALAGHSIDSIVNLYLDGRQVHWDTTGQYYTMRNGVGFGGYPDGSTHTGPDGVQYSFGGGPFPSEVFCHPFFGDQTFGPDSSNFVQIPGGGYSTSLFANDPNWAGVNGRLPCLMGCAYVYLKLEYNTSIFPQLPEIRFTVRGKNDILDPRTGTRGYTNNWALCVADQLTDTRYGLGDIDGVNQAQLIAAANVCDELVNVAATGGTEKRYCVHSVDDSSTDPANRLQKMMNAAVGRLSRIGGEWFIWPAYWQGPSFTYDENAITGPIQWEPYRSMRELGNRVSGTYIAANYPYNTAGNLYDGNGFFNGRTANYFALSFQPSSYPAYAQDQRHGYSADANLQADSGVIGTYATGTTYSAGDVVAKTVSGSIVTYKSRVDGNVGNAPDSSPTYWVPYANILPLEFSQECCLSVTQAQRCAKIYYMRNRYQGMGTIPMKLAAMAMQPLDVMQLTSPTMGWIGKVLEIVGTRFTVSAGQQAADGSWSKAPSIRFDGVAVRETGSDVYTWNPTLEELTIYDIAAVPVQQSRVPAPPTSMTLTSTPLIGIDNIVHPRVEVQWTSPADVISSQIQIQYQTQTVGVAVGSWTDAGYADAGQNLFFVSDLVAGAVYGFRIRSVRPSGATSDWAEIDGFSVAVTVSVLSNLGVGLGSLNATVLTGGVANITCNPFTARVGQLNVAILPGGATTLTTGTTAGVTSAIAPGQLYFVYYIDPTFAGGAIAPIATQSSTEFQGKVGYFLIDSIIVPIYVAPGAALRRYPTAYSDTGTSTSSNVIQAYDGNLSSYASVIGSYFRTGGSAYGHLSVFNWPATVTSAVTTLTVVRRFVGTLGSGESIISVAVAGLETTIEDSTTTGSSGSVTFSIPSGTDLSGIVVNFNVTASGSGLSGNVNFVLQVFEIYIQ
jgi:hypothetical protein